MIKTIIILSLFVIFLLVVFYPKKKCGCRSNKSNDSLVKKDNKYILTRDGSKTTFNSYSQYLKHYYYNQKDEHPLSLMESNIVSKAFPKIVEGFEDKVVSEEEIPEEEEVIIAEEEETNLNTVREKFIYNVIVQYLKKNPECIKKNKIEQFETAFANYMAFAMKKVLGNRKFDEKGGLATLSSSEFKEYINELKKMPRCDDLLKNFSKAPAEKQDIVKSREQDDKVPIKQKVSTMNTYAAPNIEHSYDRGSLLNMNNKLSNKKWMHKLIDNILSSPNFDFIMEKLTNSSFCEYNFRSIVNMPVFEKYIEGSECPVDEGNYRRYYSKPFFIKGIRYWAYSQWYSGTGLNNRPLMDKWIEKNK